jgi:hypothetical protein
VHDFGRAVRQSRREAAAAVGNAEHVLTPTNSSAKQHQQLPGFDWSDSLFEHTCDYQSLFFERSL